MGGDQKARSLREVIDHAISQIDTYKYPDTSEFTERLDPIVKALHLHGSVNDHITWLGWTKDINGVAHLGVATSYSVRSCAMSDDFSIPASVINAADPVHEARRIYLDNEVKKLQRALNDARSNVDRFSLALTKAQVEYEEHVRTTVP